MTIGEWGFFATHRIDGLGLESWNVCLLLAENSNAEKRKKLQLQAQSRNSSATEEALKLWRIEESSTDFTLYDFAELAAATADFSDENLLGRGGFGPVYKASTAVASRAAPPRRSPDRT